MAEKPVFQVRMGMIQGSVWINNYGKYPSLTVRVNKSYKVKDTKEYKTTDNYDVNDLPKLQETARQCYLWCAMKGREALQEYAKQHAPKEPQEPAQQGEPPVTNYDNDIPF